MVQQARDIGKSYQGNACLLSLSGAKNTAKLHLARVSKDLSSSAFAARSLSSLVHQPPKLFCFSAK